MRNILLHTGVMLAVLLQAGVAAAQSDVALATRQADLKALSATLKKRDAADRVRASEFARGLGIPIRRELPNGRVLELQRIAPGIGPVFYITNNVDAADTVPTDEVWPGGSAGLNIDGNSMTVGEWDGGAVYAAHTDLIGRVTPDDFTGLRDALRADVDPRTGKPVFDLAVALSLLVFFVFALQCISTVAVMARETGTWRWPAFALAYTYALAWVASFVTYNVAKLFA